MKKLVRGDASDEKTNYLPLKSEIQHQAKSSLMGEIGVIVNTIFDVDCNE